MIHGKNPPQSYEEMNLAADAKRGSKMYRAESSEFVDGEISRLKESVEAAREQAQSGMEEVVSEIENKCRELENSFFDLQMENLQLKKELDKYKNGTGGF